MGRKNIVLLHGWGASTGKLEPLSKSLQKLGWRVFVPALPGFDASPPVSPWGLMEYAGYIKKESSNFFGRERFFVFGHSFGGRITTKMALNYQNLLKGIILCASSGFSRPSVFKRALFYFLAKLGKLFLASPSIASLWKRVIYKLAREHDYEKADETMRQVFKKIVSEDLKKQVRKIRVPVLVLWGALDKMTPLKDAYFIKKSLPDSKLKVYVKAGHRLPYEKPDELAKEINEWAMNLK